MFRWLFSRYIWGSLLVLGGVALLLQDLNILPHAGSLFWAALFLLGGAAFLLEYSDHRQHWWALIPGFTLLGLASSSLLNALFPSLVNMLGGLLFFVGVSLGFVFIFFIQRQQWWAIIPAGVFATLGIISLVDSLNAGIDSGGLLFLGIGLTFIILAALPGYGSMLRWGYIPGGILLIFGLLISATSADLINLVFPAFLILLGLILVLRSALITRVN